MTRDHTRSEQADHRRLEDEQHEDIAEDTQRKRKTEAFDRSSICRTKYSLSTKIAESLRSGACILAYGPDEIASIDYLKQHHSACILREAGELPGTVQRLCAAPEEYRAYTQSARSLAEQFHSAECNETRMKEILAEAIRNFSTI